MRATARQEKGRSEWEDREYKVDSTLKEGREKGRAEIFSKRSRKKHEGVSGPKISLGGSGYSWFHSKSGQT